MNLSRRDFVRTTSAVLCAAGLTRTSTLAAEVTRPKPNSKWAGVQIGMNVPYSFGTRTGMTAEEVLEKCIDINVSAVELRAQAIEKSFGLPPDLMMGPAPSDYYCSGTPVGEIPGEPGNHAHTMPGGPEALANYNATANKLSEWRLTVPMSKAKELRKKYDDGGVAIDFVKFDGLSDMRDGELDYAFTLAKNLGARGLSAELSMPDVKKLAEAGDKHKMIVALHGHEAMTAELFEHAFSYGPYIWANLDIGHFVGGSDTSPVPFIKQHHDRIAFLHVRDEKLGHGENRASQMFGEGDVPLKEILQTIRDNKWPIQGMIEFDVRSSAWPPGDDRDAVLKKCLQYCKDCLLS